MLVAPRDLFIPLPAELNVISVLLPWCKVIRVWKPILFQNRTLQKCVSMVRSAVKQYRVSILLILSLKFLFPSHSVTKCRFCSWCRATVSLGSLRAGVIPGMPSMVVKCETEILPVCDGGLQGPLLLAPAGSCFPDGDDAVFHEQKQKAGWGRVRCGRRGAARCASSAFLQAWRTAFERRVCWDYGTISHRLQARSEVVGICSSFALAHTFLPVGRASQCQSAGLVVGGRNNNAILCLSPWLFNFRA